MDIAVTPIGVTTLMAHFLTNALGLRLDGHVPGEAESGALNGMLGRSESFTCEAWQTDQGIVRICGALDPEQSHRISASVLYFSWQLANGVRHEGWWRCDCKRPTDWTKGRGRECRDMDPAVVSKGLRI